MCRIGFIRNYSGRLVNLNYVSGHSDDTSIWKFCVRIRHGDLSRVDESCSGQRVSYYTWPINLKILCLDQTCWLVAGWRVVFGSTSLLLYSGLDLVCQPIFDPISTPYSASAFILPPFWGFVINLAVSLFTYFPSSSSPISHRWN